MDSLLSALTVALGLLVIAWLCGPVDPRGRAANSARGHATMGQTSMDQTPLGPQDTQSRVALHVSPAAPADDHVPIALNPPASTTGP